MREVERDPVAIPKQALVMQVSLLVLSLGASIALWAVEAGGDVTNGVAEATLLALFALAGVVGAFLRTLGYLLAFGSFTERERRQWKLEAWVAPALGAIAGLAAYLVVRASLVQGAEGVNRSGQYVLSVLAGLIALGQASKLIERGLLHGSLNRSGILGGEISTSVPVLQRIEQTIEQRATEYALHDYDGLVQIRSRRASPSLWELTLTFTTNTGTTEGASGARESASGRVKIQGGMTSINVPFTATVVSDTYKSIPRTLSLVVPAKGNSEPTTIMLERREPPPASGIPSDSGERFGERLVAVEIGQGSQTVQVVPLNLSREDD